MGGQKERTIFNMLAAGGWTALLNALCVSRIWAWIAGSVGQIPANVYMECVNACVWPLVHSFMIDMHRGHIDANAHSMKRGEK